MATPSSVPEGFKGQLVLGSIRGIRKFRLTPDNHLTGLFYRQAWLPGENIAYHHKVETNFVYPYHGMGAFITHSPASIVIEPTPENPTIHRGAEFAPCKCGFYAFYSEVTSKGVSYLAEVPAVIEGYGEVVIGSKGFRALKAKIVAVTLKPDLPPDRLESFAERYPGVPMFNDKDRMKAEYPTSTTEEFDETDKK